MVEDFFFVIFSIDEIIEDVCNGKMYIFVDVEDCENEGDLIILVNFVMLEVVNFMVKFGCGLICLVMIGECGWVFNFDMMVCENCESMGIVFIVFIEVVEGVIIGIFVYDCSYMV